MRVPPLRERLEDVPTFVEHFLERIAERDGLTVRTVDASGMELLASLDYPGNVRELRNLIEGAHVFAEGTVITRADLEQVAAGKPVFSRRAPGTADPFDAPTFEEFKNRSEALFFRLKLDENAGNVKRTAERLGMQRSHLYKKLDRYELRRSNGNSGGNEGTFVGPDS